MTPKNNPIIIIPARLNASRFPNKPLKLINGTPMIIKILKQALEADIAKVIVAAGDKEIVDCVKDYHGEAILTDPNLPSGTDRVAAALKEINKQNNFDIIINLQGDLAVFENELLTACLNGLINNPSYDISTVGVPITNPKLINSNTTAKAIVAFTESNKYGRALYFTRNPAPWGEGDFYQHVGIYGYRKLALEKFVKLPVSKLEQREKLEQLRALEYGMSIILTTVNSSPLEVNTKEDLIEIEKILKTK